MHLSEAKQASFAGAAVVLFESRQSKALAGRVADFGGVPVCAPSVKEVPLQDSPALWELGANLLAGRVDVIIFMTGFGVRLLIETLSTRYEQEELLGCLRLVTILTRGLKPAQALREYEVPATIAVPDPATWEAIVETLRFSERSLPLEGKRVAIVESGGASVRLSDAIRALGAHVSTVALYRWALPDDLAPLNAAIDRVLNRQAGYLLFTNATQARHVMQVAADRGQAEAFRQACRGLIIASVGLLTSRELAQQGLRVDFEAVHPRMSSLVVELAAQARTQSGTGGEARVKPIASSTTIEPAASAAPAGSERRQSAPFLRACRRESVSHTPIWLMRQAGRFMQAYRDLRSRVPFVDLCKSPELVTEVTVMAAQRLGVDAAILFSDLLLVLEPMGLGLEYSQGEGPIITGRVAGAADVDRLREIDVRSSLKYVFDAVTMVRQALPDNLPLIGFAGAPFTLASYMIEGGSSRTFTDTKRFIWRDAGAWHALMDKITRALIAYINGQIDAGADAIQIFDSWVGCLSPSDYREFVLPHTQAVIRALKPGTPVIHFGTGTAAFLKEMREAGGDVIGVDFRVELDAAWQAIGYDKGIQGNLDPAILSAGLDVIRRKARYILDQAANRPGHIFNLGHGVLPDTPEAHVVALVDMVHEMSRR